MKTIKSISPAIIILLLFAQSYAISKPVATVLNSAEQVDRHLSGFSSIDLAGPFDIYITQGSNESVKVEAPSDVINKVLTEVNAGVLKVYSKHDNWNWGNWWGNHRKIKIYVTAKDLNAISISGSGDVYFKEGITSQSLKLRISGSGDMLGKVSVKMLESSISGSGDMKLSGSADESTVKVVGSGDFTARNLLTRNTVVRVTGSGDAEVNASEKIEAAVNGSGDIHYSGAVKNISSSKSGSGDISRF